ncbi:MAG: hypothetical protein LBQ65_10000 [Tannerellaceae bacterium]|nr:hypothetical protein [Tannerellaceae bacterium]
MKQLILCLLLVLLGACEIYHSSESGADPGGSLGQGGSMARFAVSGDYLYTVDHSHLRLFDISKAEEPEFLSGKDQYMDMGIETIFPMDTLLFIGSQTGMYIFNITRPAFPQPISHVSHITSCDPVVASGNYAYVTLNSEHYWCGRSTNELHIYDLTDIYNPALIHIEMAFLHPKGLGIDGNKLFICDDVLKVYDVSDPAKPIWIDDTTDIPQAAWMDAYDVIPLNGVLLLIGAKGLYQFDYTGDKLSFISKIEVSTAD